MTPVAGAEMAEMIIPSSASVTPPSALEAAGACEVATSVLSTSCTDAVFEFCPTVFPFESTFTTRCSGPQIA
jgi:hypothetical protein